MQLTASQRDALVKNLKLELNDRISRLRSQHTIMAKALRARIEMRINRVPKRLWTKTLRELKEEQMEREVNGEQAYHTTAAKAARKPADSTGKLNVAKVRTSPAKPTQQQQKPATTTKTGAKQTKAKKPAQTKLVMQKSATKTTAATDKVGKQSTVKRTASAARKAVEKAGTATRRNLRSQK